MPLTKWSFFWGGDIPDDPTYWGGNINGGPDYDSPGAPGEAVGRISFSSIWQGEDTARAEADEPEGVTAGDTIGWAPERAGLFEKSGDLTAICTFDDQSLTQSLIVVRGDEAGGQVFSTDATNVVEQIHAELFGDDNVTGGLVPQPPAFVILVEEAGPGLEYTTWNFPIINLTALPFKATQWDNELSVPAQKCRMVSLESKGMVFVVPASSTTPAWGSALYLKSTFGGGAAIPATEIKIDLRPSESWTVDLDRLHVIATHNRVLVFYYAITNASAGISSTAVMVYTPFHSTATDDLVFNVEGVVHQPTVFVNNLLPVIAHKGARRHGVSNDLLIALEDPQDAKPQVHWLTSRGLGLVSDPVVDVWNEFTHPNLFGGRADQACPARDIDIISVGWTGGRQEGTFQVVGSMSYGAPADGNVDFVNTYALDITLHQDLKRLLIGVVQVVSEEQANVGGLHEVVMVRTAYMHTDESRRQGYDTTHDIFSAVSLIRLDNVGPGGNVATEIGPTAVGDSTLVPTVGMVGTSLFFPEPLSNVQVTGATSFNGDSVVIALWVFPQLAGRVGATDQYTIVVRNGGDDQVMRLFWDEGITKAFKWRVDTLPGSDKTIDTTVMGSLAPDRWYHVTALYNATSLKMQLFLFGVLVAEDTFVADSVLAHSVGAPLDLFIGTNPVVGTQSAMLGRIDDFVMGTNPMTHQQVVASFFQSTVASDGPVRTSRSDNVDLQDMIYATASSVQIGKPLSIVTVAARKCNFHTEDPFQHHAVFDVWKLDRNFGSEPKYLGTIAPFAGFMNQIDLSGGNMSSPVVSDTFPRGSDFHIQLIPETDSVLGGNTGKLNLYALFKGDDSGPGSGRRAVMRCRFDPDAPVLASQDETAYDWVVRFPTNRVLAWTAISRPVVGQDVWVGVVSTDTPGQEFKVMEEPRYNGVGSPNTRSADVTLPAANLTGSFFGYTYDTDFNTELGTATALVRGMTGRTLQEGFGWPSALVSSEDVQVTFGLACNVGGAKIAATAPQEQIIGTCVLIIPEGAITGSHEVGPFPLHAELQAKQLDEYGVGGVDPFVPLVWSQNPHTKNEASSPNTGDTLMLGVSGGRDFDQPGREGQGGLILYKAKREGNWGVRAVLDAGPTWGASESVTAGASMAVSTRTELTTPDFTPPTDNVVICRPLFDRTDRYSTIYMSTAEATDGGWDVGAGELATPVLRRNDRSSSLVWMGWAFDVRAWNEKPTGITFKKGTKRRAALTLRWTLPGEAYTQVIPNP